MGVHVCSFVRACVCVCLFVCVWFHVGELMGVRESVCVCVCVCVREWV